MSIIATVTGCKQVGIDSFRDVHTSREFDETRPITEVIEWAKSVLGKDYQSINDVKFSEITRTTL